MVAARVAVLGLVAVLAAGDAAGQVSARLERSQLTLGESTTLIIAVSGGDAETPDLDLPWGLEVLGTSRSKNVSWINGKLTSETVFRYEIGPTETGRFEIGPILVRAGREVFRSGVLTLTATAAERRVGGSGGSGAGPASLIVDAIPPNPVVGQLVMLRVRLIQRVAFAEDPQYTPPTTTGFWTDRPSAPESFYADQGGERVLVTETRMRLYPVASGTATVGEAAATVVVAANGGLADPFAWLSGRARREQVVRSRPVQVRVRALPPGAPATFTGAVGDFEVAWSADRARTSRDVPVTMRLEVRGRGNLPLVRPPQLDDDDVELFARTVDDSLSEPGTDLAGRKRFQWTVLPRRQGTLEIEAPEFSWYDPAAHEWRRVRADPVAIEVGPPIFSGAQGAGEFPTALATPIDPGARRAAPWAWALGGLVLGAAVALWRRGGARPAHGAERAQQLEWLRAIGRASGPDFWRAADEATAWLEAQGQTVTAVRERIAAARYARTPDADAEPVRRRLVEQLSLALPPAHPRAALRLAAVVLAAGAIAWLALFGPGAGDPRERRIASEADQAARAGDLARARTGWQALWRAGHRHPALAARLAWAEVERGAVGPASLWVLRGEVAEPRDPSLAWVTGRVREAGGLVGAEAPRAPLTRLEWAAAAALFGLLAGVLWPRRAAIALAVLVAVAGAWNPVEGWWIERSGRAVVLRAAALEGESIELQPGQVVTVEGLGPGRARVAAGDAVRGWLPADAIGRL